MAKVRTTKVTYRPGEKVHFKGIVRHYKAGKLTLVTASKLKVKAIGPNGKVLDIDEFTLNAVGTFSGSFVTAENVPLGRWRLVATIDGTPYPGEFAIEKYRNEPVCKL